MTRRRLLWQLYPPYMSIVLVSLLALTLYSSHYQRDSYQHQVATSLESGAQLVMEAVRPLLSPRDDAAVQATLGLLSQRAGLRLTVILPDGTVIADSSEDPARMDNHSERPEVHAALGGTVGRQQRYSHTVGADLMYVALPLRADDSRILAVVRTAVPLTQVEGAVSRMYLRMLAVGLGVALVASGIIWWLSRRISRPLEAMREGAQRFSRGELAVRLPVPDSEEIGGLAEAMNQMAAQLEDRINTMARQRNELEAVLSSMAEGVLAVDSEERLISLNRAAAQLLGVQPAQAQGRPIQELVRNADLLRFVARALAGEEPLEGDLVFRDPGERHIRAQGAVLRDAAGRAIGALVVLNDLTRLRRLENIRRDFVANVSHEIRTPITSIKGFVETLMDGAINQPKEAARFLSIIAKQADRLGAIIDDLLALSRIEEEAEREQIALSLLPLRATLIAAVQACELAARDKQINLQLACPDDLSARINPTMLEQAVINLIDNAVKYSEPGTAVNVQAECRDREVRIQVVDQGSGIPAEHLPRLFERFYRVDKARSRKLGGTGLGLAIVKHIVQAHKGRVEVESKPGSGSTFTIHLPAE